MHISQMNHLADRGHFEVILHLSPLKGSIRVLIYRVGDEIQNNVNSTMKLTTITAGIIYLPCKHPFNHYIIVLIWLLGIFIRMDIYSPC